MKESRRMSRLFFAALPLGAAGRIAAGDCAREWLYGPGRGLAGTNGTVHASTGCHPAATPFIHPGQLDLNAAPLQTAPSLVRCEDQGGR